MARGLQEIATDQDEDYRIPDEELPARCVLESILEQLETGNVETHTWSEIVSLREEDRERRKGERRTLFRYPHERHFLKAITPSVGQDANGQR